MKAKKIIINTLFIALAGCSIAGCQKDNSVAAQPEKANFNIAAPLTGATYKKGDVINIAATIDYIAEMHGYSLIIKNKNTGDTCYTYDAHAHGSRLIIAQQWTDTMSAPADLQLIISAEIDHEGNVASSSVDFKNQP